MHSVDIRTDGRKKNGRCNTDCSSQSDECADGDAVRAGFVFLNLREGQTEAVCDGELRDSPFASGGTQVRTYDAVCIRQSASGALLAIVFVVLGNRRFRWDHCFRGDRAFDGNSTIGGIVPFFLSESHVPCDNLSESGGSLALAAYIGGCSFLRYATASEALAAAVKMARLSDFTSVSHCARYCA